MKLRPRYSLLTLLVLTALVAGGVKLWYGPHHVVERTGENYDLEYSYTRDWRGNKTVEGPVFARGYQNGVLEGFTLHYFQRGEDSVWIYECRVKKGVGQPEIVTPSDEDCPLSKQELQIFYQARNEELQRIKNAGLGIYLQFEGRNEFEYKMPLTPK